MSGTERALQILQSGFVWSSAPYDSEATKILHAIAQLSPKRIKNDSWQTVTWPDFIPQRSAQDTFVFIVKRLLEDSQRLRELHFQSELDQLELNPDEMDLDLNKRQYLQCLPLQPNFRVSDIFIDHDEMRTSALTTHRISLHTNTQKVSILYHRKAYNIPEDLDLKAFFKKSSGKKSLHGNVHVELIQKILEHEVEYSFSNLWLSLYDYARGKPRNFKDKEFALILSLLAHEDNNLSAILALQAISMNQHAFKSIDPPAVDAFALHEGIYDAKSVTRLIKNQHKYPTVFYGQDFDKEGYENKLKKTIQEMVQKVKNKWPCDSIDLQADGVNGNINIRLASQRVSVKLKNWNNNRKLFIFIESVESVLRNFCDSSTNVEIPELTPLSVPDPIEWPKYEIDFKQKMCDRLDHFQSEIEDARNIWENNPTDDEDMRSADDWWSVYRDIVNGPKSTHLIHAGLYPRAVPSLILPEIIADGDDELKPVIGALAIKIAQEQRQKRIKIYSQHEQLRAAMERERQNKPHMNWHPSKYPEWLLFEIEQNLTIRRIQVKIAIRMMKPPDIEKKHSVMQLNMGEGKTSVIVPMIASILANGEQACQISVLKSLFATNLKSLRGYLGGMLNRRIYIFPCRRDMQISQYVAEILDIYEECKQMKGKSIVS